MPVLALATVLAGVTPGAATGETVRAATYAERLSEAMKGARWTGPMLASTAETLPKGHFYTEPYFFDVMVDGEHYPGSSGFYQYGLRDDLTVGFQPNFSFGRGEVIGFGDVKALGQLRLTHFTPEHRIPTVAIVVNERLPLASYDRLGPEQHAHGSGSFVTELGVNVQHWFLMPNGRLLRARVNVLKSFPHGANVDGRSVYGTPADFRGRAEPGSVTTMIAAVEYSVTKEWLVALDVIREATGATRVEGQTAGGSYRQVSPASRGWGFAPAIEYNWDDQTGVLLGLWINRKGHNRPKSVTPALAISRFW